MPHRHSIVYVDDLLLGGIKNRSRYAWSNDTLFHGFFCEFIH